MASIFTTDHIKDARTLGLAPGVWPVFLTIDSIPCLQGQHYHRGLGLDLLYVKYHAIEDPSKVFRVIND
jgi:hypothetical protein